MNKYFELKDKDEVLYGIVENIPEETTLEEIKERIETKEVDYTVSNNELNLYPTKSISIVDLEFNQPDIVMDWLSIDFEQGLDPNLVDVNDCLLEAQDCGLESEVVFTALKSMKENPNLSISEAIKCGLSEWVK